MRVLGFQLENFMRIRAVNVRPTQRVTIVSGKNGQGKTSLMTGFIATLFGKVATPEDPVRKGAKNAVGQLWVGDGEHELLITRTINRDRTQSLRVEPAKNGWVSGAPFGSPQDLLTGEHGLISHMARDPIAFIQMPVKEQIEVLREVSKVECDFDALNVDNKRDYDERTAAGKDAKRLEGDLRAMTVQAGLPAAKLDEAPVREKMASASEATQNARAIDAAKAELKEKAQGLERDVKAFTETRKAHVGRIDMLKKQIADEEKAMAAVERKLAKASEDWTAAVDAWDHAPAGELVDVSALAAELGEIQLTNREIDKRTRREALEAELVAVQRKVGDLTQAMEKREEQKAGALRDAKMPVEGLTFDEELVLFKGIPLAQMGEAEQLRISAEIVMAGDPKLRVLPIWRGEALDDDNLAMLDELAEARDFWVLMLKVDSSGTVGIVLEDGEVKTVNAACQPNYL